ncbi:MAG: hypothetical protein HC914_20605, partial [Chloroflexaceae bacterium]|nr:hypothetical protein [Chloroflexaceae bacterium]
VYFTADDGSSGRELWRSDGTAAGTVLVQDIYPGAAGSDPQDIELVDGILYFTADTGVDGRSLWTVPAQDATPTPVGVYLPRLLRMPTPTPTITPTPTNTPSPTPIVHNIGLSAVNGTGRQVQPGTDVTFPIRIVNNGNVGAVVELRVAQPCNLSIANCVEFFNRTSIALPPGTQWDILMKVDVPANAPAGALAPIELEAVVDGQVWNDIVVVVQVVAPTATPRPRPTATPTPRPGPKRPG